MNSVHDSVLRCVLSPKKMVEDFTGYISNYSPRSGVGKADDAARHELLGWD